MTSKKRDQSNVVKLPSRNSAPDESEFVVSYRNSVALTTRAKKYLSERGMTLKVANDNGLRSTIDGPLGEGILIPHRRLDGTVLKTGRVRNLDVTEPKFLPLGFRGQHCPNTFYYAAGPDWSRTAESASTAVAFTEGEIKGGVASAVVPTIALGGIWNWRGRTPGDDERTAPLPDFGDWQWEGRVVYIIPDSDAGDGTKTVGLAVVQLGAHLQGLGADVRIVRLPSEGRKKVGVDDFIAAQGTKAFRALLEQAPSLDDPAFYQWGVPQSKQRYTDNGVAEHFILDHGHAVRYVHGSAQWLQWSGDRWRADTGRRREEQVIDTARRLQHEAAKLKDSKQRAAEFAAACAIENAQRIPRVLSRVETKAPVSTEARQWDSDPMLFACANGVIDLRTGRFRPNEPGLLITRYSSVAYDPEAQAPRWERFLNEVFADDASLVGFVRRFVGYAMTGETHEQVFAVFHGTGSNGKGVIVRVLEQLLGDHMVSAEPETIMVSRSDGGRARSDIARLAGKRLVSTVELEEGCVLSESLVKRFAGQDTIAARTLYKSEVEFRPQFKLLISTNAKPQIHGTDHAIWRRVRLIPFTRVFKRDDEPTLEQTLRAELPGILNWAVRASVEWQRHGLGTPKVVQAATDEYRTEQDVLGAWFEECCELDPGYEVATRALHHSYIDWCERTKWRRPLHDNTFGAKVRERWSIEKKRDRAGGRWYVGLRLRNTGSGIENLDSVQRSVTHRRSK